MRHLLCPGFNICGYHPLSGIKRRHSNDEREPGNTNSRFERITDDENEDSNERHEHP